MTLTDSDVNARLIAAAPDLLAACIDMHAAITSHLLANSDNPETSPRLKRAEAAIAQATQPKQANP